jgi:hypothetical protein
VTTTTTDDVTTTTTDDVTTTTTEPEEGWLKLKKKIFGTVPGDPEDFYYKVTGPNPATTVVDEGYFPAGGEVVIGPLVPGEYTVSELDPGYPWSVVIDDGYGDPTDGIVMVYAGSAEQEPVLVEVSNTGLTTTTTDVVTTTTDDVTTTTGFITTTTDDVTTTTGFITTTTEGDTTTTSTPTTVSRATTTTTVLGVLGVQAGGGGLAGGGPVGWVLIVLGGLTVVGGTARYLKPGVKTSN